MKEIKKNIKIIILKNYKKFIIKKFIIKKFNLKIR